MVQFKKNKCALCLLLVLAAFNSFGATDSETDTHSLLCAVNKNWEDLQYKIVYTFAPKTEQTLVQLHLRNVVAYLEGKSIADLNKKQRKNRLQNINNLKAYCQRGVFPVNLVSASRVPVFIDFRDTHCAVGHLLAQNGLENVAQAIAEKQLTSYLPAIVHPQLISWQKECGLSLFELALIQPTYGPPIPVCAVPSPIVWTPAPTDNHQIIKLFESQDNNSIYSVAQIDELGLAHQVLNYTTHKKQWTQVGSQLQGDVLDLIVCQNEVYISAFLPYEKHPHQLLKLVGQDWQLAAYFNGNVKSIQRLDKKLYILGDFNLANDSVAANFVVLDGNSILPFRPVGMRTNAFDQIKASETALFLTSHGSLSKFQNDTIKPLGYIEHFQYLTNISLDAVGDTLYVASINIAGYYSYANGLAKTHFISNTVHGQDYPYSTINFTQCKSLDGKMIIAGDFIASTLIPQINDERYITLCPDAKDAQWYGEGLLYQVGQMYYPILDKGVVLDFARLGDEIYLLKKDGSLSFASLAEIEERIALFGG